MTNIEKTFKVVSYDYDDYYATEENPAWEYQDCVKSFETREEANNFTKNFYYTKVIRVFTTKKKRIIRKIKRSFRVLKELWKFRNKDKSNSRILYYCKRHWYRTYIRR